MASIVDTARTYGVGTLMIKSGDGTTAWSQFNPLLISTLHADGLKVCGWQYVYGDHPIYEAEVGAAAVQAGADCLLIDAESEYQGKYVQAQAYVKKLRQLIGPSFPVGLAGFPYVDYHPAFPYSVFLGPGGAQYNVPQMYWPDIGVSVDDVYLHTYSFNLPFQRPIAPLGEVAGDPAPSEVIRFRQMSRAYGASGVSWWDWQQSSSRDWGALGQPVGNLPAFTAAAPMAAPERPIGGWHLGRRSRRLGAGAPGRRRSAGPDRRVVRGCDPDGGWAVPDRPRPPGDGRDRPAHLAGAAPLPAGQGDVEHAAGSDGRHRLAQGDGLAHAPPVGGSLVGPAAGPRLRDPA